MNDLTTDVVDAMSAVHALSGCDYKSSFSGIGKVKVLKIICKGKRYYHQQGMPLILQTKRSNFQVAEWKYALIAGKTPPDPNGNGWERK